MERLTDAERWILEFESTYEGRGSAGQKFRAIQAAGWTGTRTGYFLQLNTALTKPEAQLEYPELTRRLLRLRDRRAQERHPR